MKRQRTRRILCAFLLCLLLAAPAWAAGTQGVVEAQSESLDLGGLQNAAGEYGGGIDLTPDLSLDQGIQRILDTGSGQINGVIRKAVRSAVLLLTIVLLCGLADGLCDGLGPYGYFKLAYIDGDQRSM